MNLMQKLNGVMKKVGYVQKDKSIGDGRYAYTVATYDQVLAAVREHLVEAGIVVVTRQVGQGRLVGTGTFYGGRDNKPGVEALRYEALYEIDFIDMDNPEDKITVPVEAHAIDQGDKAPGKALTYATKGAIKKVLLLESGDEEEDRVDASGGAPAIKQPTEKAPETAPGKAGKPPANDVACTPGEIAFLKRKLNDSGLELKALLEAVGAESLDTITKNQWAAGKKWVASGGA